MAIHKQAITMLSNSDEKGFMGIGGMKNACNDITSWADAKDWQWCARFSYQVIERRGTGGGAFRLMYSKFLHEASTYIPQIAKLELPERMKKIAEMWTELSVIFKEISELERPAKLDLAGKKLKNICEQEEKIYHDMLKISDGRS